MKYMLILFALLVFSLAPAAQTPSPGKPGMAPEEAEHWTNDERDELALVFNAFLEARRAAKEAERALFAFMVQHGLDHEEDPTTEPVVPDPDPNPEIEPELDPLPDPELDPEPEVDPTPDPEPMPNATVIDFRLTSQPGETVPGLRINYDTWTGNTRLETGRNFHIIGHGKGQTFISGGETPIVIGDDSGVVTIEGVTIVCGPQYGINYGSQRGWWHINEEGDSYYKRYSRYEKHYPDSKLRLIDVEIVTRAPGPNENRITTQWPIKTVNVDHEWIRTRIATPHSKEHCYLKGWARDGFYARELEMSGAGGECIKFATRPAEAHYVPNAKCDIDGFVADGWGQAWGGGGAFVFQGPAFAEISIRNGTLTGSSGSPACLRFDDGLSTGQNAENNALRYYDVTGVAAGPGACVGKVTLENIAMFSSNGESLRIGSIYSNYGAIGIPPHKVANELVIDSVGSYGSNSRLTIGDTGTLTVNAFNVPALSALHSSSGDTSQRAALHVAGDVVRN